MLGLLAAPLVGAASSVAATAGGWMRPIRAFRTANVKRYQGTRGEWSSVETKAWRAPYTEGAAVRVMLLRHGMGFHNDLYGGFSFANRDAKLNTIGREQAIISGNMLRDAGILDDLDLVVVSPFRRALQTAHLALGPEGVKTPTYIQPLAAEHTFNWSAVQQGDRGSTPAELRDEFPEAGYPQFDFDTVTRYCEEKGVLDEGAWWHHGPGTSETHASFTNRTTELREWVGKVRCASENRPSRLLLVGHGGLFRKAWGGTKFQNCEFRLFDMMSDGSFVRVSTGEQGGVAVPRSLAAVPVRERLAIHTCSSSHAGKLFQISGAVDGVDFSGSWLLSQLQDEIYTAVRRALTDEALVALLGPVGYSSPVVQDVIWAFPKKTALRKNSTGLVGKLRAWFENLGALVDKDWFPSELFDHITSFLTDLDGDDREYIGAEGTDGTDDADAAQASATDVSDDETALQVKNLDTGDRGTLGEISYRIDEVTGLMVPVVDLDPGSDRSVADSVQKRPDGRGSPTAELT